jgi:hypothetical protein
MSQIPKKQLKLIIALMEALPSDMDSPPAYNCLYDGFEDLYSGPYCEQTAAKLEQQGHALIITKADEQYIRLNRRDDFLVSFAAGVLEAQRGNSIDYAEYSNHPFAFCCGYTHALNKQKSQMPNYNLSKQFVCHGFECEDTSEVYSQ